LAAMAPVTGSDALHYHFTAPLLTVESGFHPDFFLSHSFFTGQGHLLILAGLALGSEQLAMGLLFLGGVLAALGAAALAARWSSPAWGWTAALTFLLTPVVFWQTTTAGAPDIWMAFFVVAGLLLISEAPNLPALSGAIVTGALAGAIAGTKYTGCIIAAAMAVAYFWEARSFARELLFFLGALIAGVYPYARNLVWTGDPVFPFLLRWISPAHVNAFGLASLLADTGAEGHRSLWQLVKFPFFAAIDDAHLGFWQFLGPIVLAFAPLLVLVVRNTPAWRAALTIWILSAIGIGVSSGMLRFMVPLLPIALAAILSGVAQALNKGWKAVKYVSVLTVAAFLFFGAGAFALYARGALAAASGLTSRKQYLERQAPDYAAAEFVNQTLSAGAKQGKTVVFLRHLFYLRVPYLNCDPASSWAIDPSRLQTAGQWLTLFREQNVRWVVRGANYPEPIAAPLEELERENRLVPIASTKVANFTGLRISGQRESAPVVILELR
jgi:MFS family permease